MNIYFNTSFIKKNGKLFEKELARTGVFTDANGRDVEITVDMFNELVETFNKFGKVFVPIGHPERKVTEEGVKYDYDDLLTKNMGWVESIAVDGESLMGQIRITDPLMASKIEDGSVLDDSIGVVMVDGKLVLEHVALTLIPAITDLSEFKPLPVELGREGSEEVMLFSRKIEILNKEDVMADEKVIELEKAVTEAKAKAEAFELEKKSMLEQIELSKKEAEAYVAELSKLKEEKAVIEAKEREAKVDKYISEGKITPAQKEKAIALMSKDAETFEAFLLENTGAPVKAVKEIIQETVTMMSRKEYDSKVKGLAKDKEAYAELLEAVKTGKVIIE